MKFALIYQVQLPKPWTDVSEYQLFQNILTQVGFAEEMGFEFAQGMDGGSLPTSGKILPDPRAPRA